MTRPITTKHSPANPGRFRRQMANLSGRLLHQQAAAVAMVGAAVVRAERSQRLGWGWDRVCRPAMLRWLDASVWRRF